MCPAPTSPTKERTNTASTTEPEEEEQPPVDRVLTAGLFPPEDHADCRHRNIGDEVDDELIEDFETDSEDAHAGQMNSVEHPTPYQSDAPANSNAEPSGNSEDPQAQGLPFTFDETLFVFDWDDTILPSTWLQRQGLRLDDGSFVSQWHKEQLAEVATTAIELITNAKQTGTVVLVTNAERGWIELSCQKFLPSLLPILESVKAVSARTTFESRSGSSPLEWKLRAFEREINGIWGKEMRHGKDSRKNVFSLGDSVHEREAMLRATAKLSDCRSKSLKFVERPDISQILKQHSLVNSCFERVLHHDGNLDLCIKCT